KRRTAKGFRKGRHEPECQQSDSGQNESEDINNHRMQKGLYVVVVKLGSSFLEFVIKFRLEPRFIVVHRAIKTFRVILVIRSGHSGEVGHRRVKLVGERAFEQTGARVLPAITA